MMDYRTNVKAVLETCFAGFKDELIEAAADRICNLKEKPLFIIKADGNIEPLNTAITNGKPLDAVLDKIRAEIESCLNALDEIEKSGFNIYLPNEMSGRRLTYKQCLGFIDKYKEERGDKE